MTKDSGSVCAIVVTYNRKNLLIECLEALRRQTHPLDGIYVIDNASTDDTPAYLMEKGYIAEIPPSVLLEPYEREYLLGNYVNGGSIRFHYVRLPENTGGAGGFHEGMKRAYEKGYDWMWLMDDDAEAKEDALEKLLLAIKAHNSLAGGSRVVNEDGATIYHHRGVFSKDCSKTSLIIPITESNSNTQFVEFCSFVGFLVNREVVRRFGLPDKRFFIFHDDLEYSLRIKDSGKILYVKDSVIVHRVSYCYSHFKKIHFLRREVVILPFRFLARRYFLARNYLTIMLRICGVAKTLKWLMLFLIKNLALSLIFYPKGKLVWSWINLRAAYDALKGNYNNAKVIALLNREINKENKR